MSCSLVEPTESPPQANPHSKLPSGDRFSSGVTLLLVMVVAQRAIGFLRNLWFCRVMAPSELGRWNLAFSLIVLAAPLFVLGLPGSFGRYVEYYQRRGQLSSFLRRTLIATYGCGLVGIGLLLLGGSRAAWLTLGDTNQTMLLIAVAISLISVIGFNALTELCTALRQVRWVAIIQFVNSILFALAGGILLEITGWGAAAAVLAYGLACLVTGLMAFIALARSGCWDASNDTPLSLNDQWQKVAPFAFGIWIANLFTNLFSAADRFMMVHFTTSKGDTAMSLVGQYHSSRVLGELIISVGLLVAGVLLPYLTREWERGSRRVVGWWINLAMKGIGLSLFAASTMVILIAPLLFQYGLHGKYAHGLTVLPGTLAYCIWFSLSSVGQTYLLCAERSRSTSLAYVAGLLVNIVLNTQLLPRFGLPGAVASTACANMTTLGVILWLGHRTGLRLHSGTWAVLGAPLLLLAGPGICLLSLLAVVSVPRCQQFIFTPRERALIAQRWWQTIQPILARIPAWKWTQPALPPVT